MTYFLLATSILGWLMYAHSRHTHNRDVARLEAQHRHELARKHIASFRTGMHAERARLGKAESEVRA